MSAPGIRHLAFGTRHSPPRHGGRRSGQAMIFVFMVPVFFLLIRSWFKSHARQDDAAQTTPAHPESAA